MFGRQLDSRTIITDITPQLPQLVDRPEPTLEQRQRAARADKVTLTEIRRLTGWTAADIDAAIGAFAFPKPLGRRMVSPRELGEPVYSRRAIADWLTRLTTFAASATGLKKL